MYRVREKRKNKLTSFFQHLFCQLQKVTYFLVTFSNGKILCPNRMNFAFLPFNLKVENRNIEEPSNDSINAHKKRNIAVCE